MAESDDPEQRARQERLRLKQTEGAQIGPERAQFWNIAPLDADFLTVAAAPESPAVTDARAQRLLDYQATVDKGIEGLTRAIAELREQIAENTRLIAELKKAIEAQ